LQSAGAAIGLFLLRLRCETARRRSDAGAYDHVELPPIKPVTTRINLNRADRPCCGKIITAEPPADMLPGSPFGPGIVGLVLSVWPCKM
jgi:hypothetical protein